MSYSENRNNEKREYKRFDIDVQATLFYDNMVYSGVIMNLSKNGMFIRTKRQFPVDTMLMATLRIDDETVQIPVQIKRAVHSDNFSVPGESGLGVHIIRSSKKYLNFVSTYSSQQMKLTL